MNDFEKCELEELDFSVVVLSDKKIVFQAEDRELFMKCIGALYKVCFDYVENKKE